MFPPSSATAGLFPQGFLFHNLPHGHHGFQFSDSTVVNTTVGDAANNNYGLLNNNANLARGEINNINNSIFASNNNNGNSYVFQEDEYGLLQDIVPSVFLKHGQWTVMLYYAVLHSM